MLSAGWRKPFFTLYSGQAVFLVSSTAVQFALIWWVTLRTSSPLALTLASFLGLVPQIVLGPFAGVLIDRYPRKVTMVLAATLVAVASAALALSCLFGEPALQLVYLILFVRAVGETFQKPALQAVVPSLVPTEELQRAGGLGQLVVSVSAMAGPMLGALLMGIAGLCAVVWLDVVGAFLAIVTVALVRLPSVVPSVPAQGVFAEMRQGFRALAANKAILAATGLLFLTGMVVLPLGSLLPLLVKNYFAGTAWQAGLVQALFSMGMLLAALVLGVFAGNQKPFTRIALSTSFLGVFLMAGGLVPAGAFWFFCLVVVGIGAAGMVGNIPYMAAIQASIPPEHLGKVIATVTSLVSLGIPFGMAVAGPVAELVGISTWMVGAGVAVFVLGAASWVFYRERRKS